MQRFRHFDQLRSFVVVAEHLNLTRAADLLSLSKGAVSHQIKVLESELGVALFHANRRTLSLTDQGQQLYRVAKANLEDIEREIRTLRAPLPQAINIGMATYFASRWLSPRLMKFMHANPDIGLRIQPLINQAEFDHHTLDMAIRWGKGEWRYPGMRVELIFNSSLMLTASIDSGQLIREQGILAAIQSSGLLHDQEGSRAWDDWFETADLPVVPARHDLVVPDPNVRVQAVIDGQGMALYDELVADELRQGKLYQHTDVVLDNYGYYLIYPEQSLHQDSMTRFRDWLLQEPRRPLYP